MQLSLAGYTTRKLLRSSAGTQVIEAERTRDGRRVVAKLFDLDEPGVLARVEHEFQLLRELDIDGVVRPLGVERSGDQLVLLLDHVDGVSLEEFAHGRPLGVERFLAIARPLTAILAQVHARQIVHRDLKPANVLIERETGKVFLADFGISVLLESERAHFYDPAVVTGTLPYISPEQTGRTRRKVDPRSDLYSLGVSFYELLTGRRPFVGAAPLELVHAHLAKRPVAPHLVDDAVPVALSDMVMRLLEKAPEHRYQSAAGLLADLDRFAEARAAGDREVSFRLGERDFPLWLQLPHQLYGREAEREQLAAALDEVVASGSRQVWAVCAGAGLGKSALVRSLEAPLSARGGYLAVGKFEPDAAEQPYQAFARAFSSLVLQLLGEPDERLAEWRQRLHDALGPIAGVVVTMVPELGLVLREVPPLAAVELGEARNRLHVAVSRLIAAVGRVRPLAIVLEDLQWADPASLELLRALAHDRQGPVLLVVSSRAALADGLPLAGTVELGPLPPAQLEQMLADVLGRAPAEVAELADLVARRTGRNPLFVRQFLVHLADLGLLAPGPGGWTWTIESIAAAPIPDDVLGIMTAKLERLDPAAYQLVQVAAVIGARIETGLLESVSELAGPVVAEALFTLEHEGLLVPTATGLQFSHEGLREAALGLLGGDGRRALQRRIGGQLRARAAARGLPPGFAVVDQLNAAHAGAIDQMPAAERLELAQLDCDAGERALATGAWDIARRYYAIAVELVAPELEAARRGGGERALVFAAHFGLAQATTLAAKADAAQRAFDELACWELSVLEHSKVVARRVRIATYQQRMQDAIATGLAGLARCGFSIPAEPSSAALAGQVGRAWLAVRALEPEAWMALPDATDDRVLAAMNIITALASPAFIAAPTLYVLLTSLHARLVVRHGYHDGAPEALAQLAIVVLALGSPKGAGQLCRDAQALMYARPTTIASILHTEAMALLMVGPAYKPFRECADPIEATCRRAIEAGERENAGYFAALGLALHLAAGTHLRELPELGARLRAENEDWGTPEMAAVAEVTLRFAAVLSAGEPELSGGDDRESGERTEPLANERPTFMARAELADREVSELTQYATVVVEIGGRLLLALCDASLDADLDRLWALHESIASDYQSVMLGTWQASRFAVFSAILAVELAARGRLSERQAQALCRQRLASLRKAAEGCAANYAPMASIVEGELERLRGHASVAIGHYEAARELAADHGLREPLGLACLRLASLGDRQGWRTVADGARRLAHLNFRGWGAWTLSDRLEWTHTHLRGHGPSGDDPATVSPHAGATDHARMSSSSNTSDLDLASVVGTMQLISADLRLDEVVPRVLAAAIENAGADRGALLLEHEGQIGLVARGQAGGQTEFLAEPLPLRQAEAELPSTVIRYVLRTGAAAIIDDLAADLRFANDPYVLATGARSLLCMPITKQRARIGALVVENRLAPKAFGSERLEVLRVLVAQAASALDNARLYAALARSEAQWRSLVDGAPDIIALLDASGTVEFVNHLQPFHVDPASLIGESVERVIDEASLSAWREAFAAIRAGAAQRELELCVAPHGLVMSEAADARRRWYATRLAAVEAGPGQAGKVLAIATDITQRKRLEAQLRQQQRLESIGTLASGVAHEINNPIQGILNYAELLGDRADDRETVVEFTAEITHESHRVASIVRNLLAFARQEREQAFEDVEVRAILDSTLSLIRAVLRKDQIQIDLEVSDPALRLRCRPQQIQQVVMNLVTNARDALNHRYPGFDANKRIEVRAGVSRPGRMRISVADRGLGIPEHVRAHIFDPFFTTKGRDQGTGLGLSVSHGIVADHGGDLTVETEPGVGTTFHLDLPAG